MSRRSNALPRNSEDGEEAKYDTGRVESAANELTRALFLPFVACPLGTERPDPRCLRVYNEWATEMSSKTEQLLVSEKQLSSQLNQLQSRYDKLTTEKTVLQAERAADKTASLLQIHDLKRSVSCFERLKDLIARASIGEDVNGDLEKYASECGDDASPLRTFLDRMVNGQREAVENKPEEGKVNQENNPAESSPEVRFLRELKDMVAQSQKQFTDDGEDSDFERIQKDALAYGVKTFGMPPPADLPGTLSEEDIKTSPDAHDVYLAIVDLIVQKSGNIRMMVRFNAAKIRGKTVTESYEKDGKNALYYDEGVQFRGYTLDPNETNIKTTLYCNKTFQKGHWKKLNFERVFLEEDQKSVYDSLKSFVFSAQNGKPLGIFAYGGTGSGKTHTLLGPSERTEENEGILGRVVRDLWSSGRDMKLDVRMLEIHPSVTTSNTGNRDVTVIGALKYRCLDLVYLKQNNNLIVDGNGKVTFSRNGMNTTQRIEYFELADSNDGQNKTNNMVHKNAFFNPFEDLYEQSKGNRTKKLETYTRDQFKKAGQRALSFVMNDDIGFVMGEINDTLAYRRSVSTAGNESGSSRSHLVVTLEFTRSEKETSDTIYIVDLAGKEYAAENPPNGFSSSAPSVKSNWALSRGINQSLDGIMRLVAVTKCKRKRATNFDAFSLTEKKNVYDAHEYLQKNKCNAKHEFMPHSDDFKKPKGSMMVPVNYVHHKGTQFRAIMYKDDPMAFITEDLWTDDDSKIMLFACMYPLVQVKTKDDELFPKNMSFQSDIQSGEAVEDAWDVHFGIKKTRRTESLHKKFDRDVGILREMDYVQNIR